jgi:hypothetical protein
MAWSTAQLSVARAGLAAASVGNVALFAGGGGQSKLVYKEWGWSVGRSLMIACVSSV